MYWKLASITLIQSFYASERYRLLMSWRELILYELNAVRFHRLGGLNGLKEWMRGFLTGSVPETKKVELLGAQVGLTHTEVGAVIDARMSRKDSILFKLTVMVFTLAIVVSVILANPTGVFGQYPATNTTYIPGTRYGSISPKDFQLGFAH